MGRHHTYGEVNENIGRRIVSSLSFNSMQNIEHILLYTSIVCRTKTIPIILQQYVKQRLYLSILQQYVELRSYPLYTLTMCIIKIIQPLYSNNMYNKDHIPSIIQQYVEQRSYLSIFQQYIEQRSYPICTLQQYVEKRSYPLYIPAICRTQIIPPLYSNNMYNNDHTPSIFQQYIEQRSCPLCTSTICSTTAIVYLYFNTM